MAILSITFHTEEQKIVEWNIYLKNELIPDIKTLGEKHIISEVESDMLSEGKNTNILLLFDNEVDRELFLEQKFPLIAEKTLKNFSDKVLIFNTFLNRITFDL